MVEFFGREVYNVAKWWCSLDEENKCARRLFLFYVIPVLCCALANASEVTLVKRTNR